MEGTRIHDVDDDEVESGKEGFFSFFTQAGERS